MTARKRRLTAELAKLGEAVATANAHARDVERQHRAAQAEVERLTEGRIEAFGAGDEQAAARLQEQRALHEGAVADFTERLEGARRAAAKAETARGVFVAENADGLVVELEPAARAAAQAVEDAVEQLGKAHAEWQQAEAACITLLRLARRDSRGMPAFPERLADLVRDARRAGGVGVPAPLPQTVATMVAAPEDDPDSRVGEQARWRLTRHSADAA